MSPDLLNTTVDVLTNTLTRSVTGGPKSSWSPTSPPRNGVPCRAEKIKSGNTEKFGGKRNIVTMMFYFDEDPSLDEHMALLHDGTRYIIQDVEDVANMGEIWQVTALDIEGIV